MTGLRQALTRTRLLGREAVATVAVVTSAVLGALPMFGWSDQVTGAVTAAVVALAGVVSAWLVSVDRALPLLAGLGKAVIAAVATFGVHLPDHWVTGLMVLLTFVSALSTRPQVGAEQPPRDRLGNVVDPLAPPGPPLFDPTKMTTADLAALRNEWEQRMPPRDAPPLPTPPDEAQRGGGAMPWSTREPSTEYLPHPSTGQTQQHRPGESTGRHHAEWWTEPRGRLDPDFG